MPPPRPAAWIASPSARNDGGGIWRTCFAERLSAGAGLTPPCRSAKAHMRTNRERAMTTTLEVLGLGNSLVDILAHADDAYLDAQEMVKGAMTLIDEDRAEALYAARVDPIVISGGSAANTIVGVASLGAPRRLYRQGQARSAGPGLCRRHPLDRREVRHPSGRARAGDGTLLRLCHAGRRADDEHLSRRQHLPFAARRRRGPGARGQGRLSRRLHVGPAGRQVRLPESRRARPRRRRAASR